MHKYADERSHVIWPVAMLLQAQSNYQLPALLHFKWWTWLKIHRQLKKVRSVLQACFYFVTTWQLGLETKSALRCWGRKVLLIRRVFSTTGSTCSWIHHFHSKIFAKSDCFPSQLWAKEDPEGGKDAGRTRCVGGGQTLQMCGQNIQTLPTREVQTCFKWASKPSFPGASSFSWDWKYHQETQMVSCFWGRATVLWAGQGTRSSLPELPSFWVECHCHCSDSKAKQSGSICPFVMVFTRGQSLPLQSDRPIKSHTLGVNLTLWGFASMLPTAMAGSYTALKPHPDPKAQQGGCICLALPVSCCQAAPFLGTWKVAGFWVTCFSLVSWLSRKTCLLNRQRFGWFLAPLQVWHSCPCGPGSELVSASCHGPFQEWLELLPVCTSLGWAQQLYPALIFWVSAEQIGAHASGISRWGCFLSQVSNLCWKGSPCFKLAKTSYFMHVLLLLQLSPSFSWDFKIPWIGTDYLCRFPEGTPCSKAPPCVSQLLSSHCGLPVSQPGQEQLPGCHPTVLQGTAVSVRKLWFSQPCRHGPVLWQHQAVGAVPRHLCHSRDISPVFCGQL